jgi:hypothetical protein
VEWGGHEVVYGVVAGAMGSPITNLVFRGFMRCWPGWCISIR